jgi:hypothetical protein
MSEQSRVMAASLAGAVIGGLAGYLYLTEHGRRFRDQMEPRLDQFIAEMQRLRAAVSKAHAAADEGWRTLNEVIGEPPRGGEWSGGQKRQASVF